METILVLKVSDIHLYPKIKSTKSDFREMMKDRIINKAKEMFLRLGFKSITMDDIACEMCISKKTIYKYFSNKEVLIEEGTEMIKQKIHSLMDEVISKNFNAIKENFEIRKMFKEMFQAVDHSPAFQLKKHYPEIYEKMMQDEIKECESVFTQNVQKGIAEGLYRVNHVTLSNALRRLSSLAFNSTLDSSTSS